MHFVKELFSDEQIGEKEVIWKLKKITKLQKLHEFDICLVTVQLI